MDRTQIEALMQPGEPVDFLRAVLGSRPAWMREALCRLPEARSVTFFPEKGQDVRPALAICSACKVQDPCLAFAREHETSGVTAGVWGATTAKQRKTARAAARCPWCRQPSTGAYCSTEHEQLDAEARRRRAARRRDAA